MGQGPIADLFSAPTVSHFKESQSEVDTQELIIQRCAQHISWLALSWALRYLAGPFRSSTWNIEGTSTTSNSPSSSLLQWLSTLPPLTLGQLCAKDCGLRAAGCLPAPHGGGWGSPHSRVQGPFPPPSSPLLAPLCGGISGQRALSIGVCVGGTVLLNLWPR